jgi:hypothetical protein
MKAAWYEKRGSARARVSTHSSQRQSSRRISLDLVLTRSRTQLRIPTSMQLEVALRSCVDIYRTDDKDFVRSPEIQSLRQGLPVPNRSNLVIPHSNVSRKSLSGSAPCSDAVNIAPLIRTAKRSAILN